MASAFAAFLHPRGWGGKFVPAPKKGPKPKKPPKPKAPAKAKTPKVPKVPKASSNKVAKGSIPKGAKVKTPTSGGKTSSGLTSAKSVTNVHGGGWGSAIKGAGSGAGAAAGGEQAIAQNAQLGGVRFLSSKPSQH